MTDISQQPQVVTLPYMVPVQIPAANGGCTLVNESGGDVILCSDDNFTATVDLPNGVTLPWTTSTTLWAMGVTQGVGNQTISVLPDAYNYYNRNVLSASGQPTPLTLGKVVTVGITSYQVEVPSVPDLMRTMILTFSMLTSAGFPQFIQIVGNTGVLYYNQPPYLADTQSGYTFYKIVVPISGADEGALNIGIFGVDVSSINNASQLIAYWDTLLYTEKTYYNGPVVMEQVVSTTPGSQVLTTGPCRLLNLRCRVGNTSATAQLVNSLYSFEYAFAGGATSPGAENVHFGESDGGIILPAYQSVNLFTTGTAGTVGVCTQAYP